MCKQVKLAKLSKTLILRAFINCTIEFLAQLKLCNVILLISFRDYDIEMQGKYPKFTQLAGRVVRN